MPNYKVKVYILRLYSFRMKSPKRLSICFKIGLKAPPFFSPPGFVKAPGHGKTGESPEPRKTTLRVSVHGESGKKIHQARTGSVDYHLYPFLKRMPKTTYQMVIYQSRRLHIGVHNSGTHKGKPLLF
jgi:hypothetical protein